MPALGHALAPAKPEHKRGCSAQGPERPLSRALLTADKTLEDIGTADTKAEQGHGRRFGEHDRGGKSRGSGSDQNQSRHDNTVHRIPQLVTSRQEEAIFVPKTKAQ